MTLINLKLEKCIVRSTSTELNQNRPVPTFEQPVGVTLFGAVGLQEGEDVLGDVFHHPRGEGRVLQMRDVLGFYHLVFLRKHLLLPLF